MIFGSLALFPVALVTSPVAEVPGVYAAPAPIIPSRYHGEWARTADQCGLPKATVENVTIGSRHVLSIPVVRVEHEVDPDRLKVWVRPADRSARELILELRGDVLVVSEQGGNAVEAVNCSPEEPDISLAIEEGWLELANDACQSGNFNNFLEAFFSSDAVKRKYLSQTIRVLRDGAPDSLVDQGLYQPPPITLSHFHGEMDLVLEDGSPNAAVVHFVDKKDRSGNWTITWSTSLADTPGDMRLREQAPGKYSQGGALVFRRDKTCWRLAEEHIRRREEQPSQQGRDVDKHTGNGE